ncbi:MAG: hypothetical protein LC790_16885 [Actinobacteria bacterium]|nr:hypothetical protein [Actinomycetota bacterium]
MVLILRAIDRVIALLLLLALALLGLATAIFSIQGDTRALSLPTLARHFHLPRLRELVGDFLSHLEAGGPVAWVSVGGGVAAIALGMLLLVGALAPRRERLVVLEQNGDARLAARPRPLAQIAGALVEQVRGVTDERTRVRPQRVGRSGRLSVSAYHSHAFSAPDIEQRASAAVTTLADAFSLRLRVRARRGAGKARVE